MWARGHLPQYPLPFYSIDPMLFDNKRIRSFRSYVDNIQISPAALVSVEVPVLSMAFFQSYKLVRGTQSDTPSTYLTHSSSNCLASHISS